jgi:hypothetical protein
VGYASYKVAERCHFFTYDELLLRVTEVAHRQLEIEVFRRQIGGPFFDPLLECSIGLFEMLVGPSEASLEDDGKENDETEDAEMEQRDDEGDESEPAEEVVCSSDGEDTLADEEKISVLRIVR